MYIASIIICIAAMAVLLPVYLKAIKPGHTVKTLIMKGTLSLLFFGIGMISAFGFGNPSSEFAKLMLGGFALSFVGDLLLHRDKGMVKYVFGGVAFLIAHVGFICAYIFASKKILPGQPFMTKGQIIALVILWAAVIALFVAFKPNFKKFAPVIVLYSAVLMFMVVKAGYLGLLLMNSGAENGTAALILLAGGAGSFALSDAILGISFFTKPTYGKKAANVVFYYIGQIMLALSLAFVK